ncbi:hypothetical protein D3C81_2039150 [compost metagenome]
MTQSRAREFKPSCARSYISRSSWPTTEVGALISRLYISVRSSSRSGAPTRRNVQDSTSVRSAAMGLKMRSVWMGPFTMMLGKYTVL